jgi:drug/metabolite transporter (DMT)-like permease
VTTLDTSWLWALFTIIAAAGQTARNAMQRELTATLGTIGATHIRFLFGFPFVLLFLAGIMLATGSALPRPPLAFWPWVLVGASAQIVATGLMLAAMGERSFAVVIAYTKTEPLHVAIFGLVFLGDRLTLSISLAILIATAGEMIMSWKSSTASMRATPVVLGIVSGATFGLSAVGYRGGILTLTDANFLMAATFTLATGIVLQSILLLVYLALRDRPVLMAILRAWRPSLFAGFMGATASEFWFLAFALTTAASVRTLGLVEVLFAQLVSAVVFKQQTSTREALGIALVIAGVVLLLWSH